MGKLATDETLAKLEATLDGIHTQNKVMAGALEVMAASKYEEAMHDFKTIQQVVRSGVAAQVFGIGDQINVKWTNTKSGTEYDVPMDIVHIGNVTLKDGETVPGLFLQWHYVAPANIRFDAAEAFYYAESELPAGTYYITFARSYGTNVKATSYSFTLEQAVPAGGQLSGFTSAPDTAPANWRVYSWTSPSATEALEIVSVTEGTTGTSLGTMPYDIPDGNINCMQRTFYGSNRYGQSAVRQWLNASGSGWWVPQTKWDRYPAEVNNYEGFMGGFPADFLNVLGEVKTVTHLNTKSDAGDGTSEELYDKFFLPSLEEMYITPELAGEGEVWEYWRRVSGLTSPMQRSSTYEQLICFGIEQKSAAQAYRFRSASRGNSVNAYRVNSLGNIGASNSSYTFRCAPACVIC